MHWRSALSDCYQSHLSGVSGACARTVRFAKSLMCIALFLFTLTNTGNAQFDERAIEASPPVEAGVLDDAGFESFMDGLIRAQMDANLIPGLAIAITEGDRIIFLKGYGFADVDNQIPVDPQEHLFRVASVSKPFAWMSLLQLAESGKIDLDEDVNAYLDFEIPDTFPGRPIRVRHLATHTTGFEAVNIGTSARVLAEQDSLGDALKRLKPRRVRAPGELTNYSNYGAALGGYIVEQVSGEQYPDYLEEHILKPLGMSHSTIRQPPEEGLADNLVTGYTSTGGRVVAGPYSYLEIYPDGAMQTTAADMARFGLAHMNPQRHPEILDRDGFAAMRTPQFANIPQVSAMTFGFEQKIWNGRVGYGHGGNMDYFTSRLLIFPEEDVSIFIALNTDSEGHARDEIIQGFMDRYFPPVSETLLYASDPVQHASDDLADTYISTRRNFSSIEKLFWPMTTGLSVERVSDDLIHLSMFGDSFPYRRLSEGVYAPDHSTLGAMNGIGAFISVRNPETGKRMAYFSQNGSFAFEEPPFLEKMSLQVIWLLVAAGLMVLGAVLSLSVAFRRKFRLPALAWGSVISGIAGITCCLVFVPLIAASFTNELVLGVPDRFYFLFSLPLIGLGLGVLAAGLAWAGRLMGKVQSKCLVVAMSALILGVVLFSGQLWIWNMLGFAGLPA